MKYFWQLNNSLSALYGATVVGCAAMFMHFWHNGLTTEAMVRVISALAILAFHTLALLTVGQQRHGTRLIKVVAVLWHLGLWCFVWTLLAGVFAWPFYYLQLAPIGGQLLIAAWLLLVVAAWRRS
jgi:uncharacterized membrane protein YgdD (TMEM256/DUF423 family)